MAETGSLSGVWKKIEAHPYVTAGAVFVVGAVIIYLYYGSGTKAAAAPTGAINNTGTLEAELQSEALQAQYGAALSSQQSQEASVAAQVNGQLALGTIEAGLSTYAIGTEGSIASQSITATESIDLASIGAGETVSLGSIAAVQNLASIQANETNLQTAGLFAYLGTQVADQYAYLNTVANNQTALQIVQAENLSASEYNALEGQIGNTTSAVATVAGNLTTTEQNLQEEDQAITNKFGFTPATALP